MLLQPKWDKQTYPIPSKSFCEGNYLVYSIPRDVGTEVQPPAIPCTVDAMDVAPFACDSGLGYEVGEERRGQSLYSL